MPRLLSSKSRGIVLGAPSSTRRTSHRVANPPSRHATTTDRQRLTMSTRVSQTPYTGSLERVKPTT